MRKSTLLIPAAMIAFAAFPAAAQEVPRVLFCQGQCFGVAQNGDRVPVTKGTELAPGLRLETGRNSYAQVKFGPDNACGIGENARVRFESGERDVVVLDQGRIRMIGGELIGRPATKPVELRTTEGTIVLRSADIEVKTLPKSVNAQPMLVKLNVGDAHIGGLPVSKDVVQGIVGGKVLDRVIPIGDIALAPREPTPSGPGGVAGREVKPPLLALPVVNLPVFEPKPVAGPVLLSPAIVAPTLVGFTKPTTSTLTGPVATTSLTVVQPAITPTLVVAQPILPASSLVLAQPVTTSTGTTSLTEIAKTIQATPTPTATQTAPLQQTFTIQSPTITDPNKTNTSILSPTYLKR